MRRVCRRSLGSVICVCLLLFCAAACATNGATRTGTPHASASQAPSSTASTSSDTASQEAESARVYRTFTIDALRCIGACGIAPAVSINGKVYPKVQVSAVPGIIEELRQQGGM